MVQFNFTYDPGITAEQRTGFELAAYIWGAYLQDDITVNLHIASVNSLEGNAIGGAVPFFYEQNYGVFKEYLANDVAPSSDGSSPSIDDQALDSLQDGNTVDVIVDGEIVDGNNQILLTSAQAKALGMDKALELENGTTWERDLIDADAIDGYIVINQSYDWNYDFLRAEAAPESTLDFLSLAMHEIGHHLGFVSGLDGPLTVNQLHSGETQANGFTLLDLFRHTAEGVTVDNPDGAVSDLTSGADAYFSVDGGTTELGLFSTGQNGDGFQAAHWRRMQVALGIMDPTLAYQERLSLTELDLQALDALGYDVNYDALHTLNIETLLLEAQLAVGDPQGFEANDYSSVFNIATTSSGMTEEQWWQIFEEQLLSLGWSDWWQILDLGFGTWFQLFGQSMINQGYGQWWQLFEQQLSQGWNLWFQKFEATVFDLGFGQWWQLFDMGNAVWWQELEFYFLTLDTSEAIDTTDTHIVGDTPLDIIYSGDIDDIIAGDEGGNQIYAGAGDDLIDGKEGDDELWGEAGRDIIYGHNGNDHIHGGVGDDWLMGEAGDDQLFGGRGHDILSGGEGDDVLTGNAGHDDLKGGIGNDILSGNFGNDRLDGGEGQDFLSGGKGQDFLSGGRGNDVIFGDAYSSADEDLLHQLKEQTQQKSDSFSDIESSATANDGDVQNQNFSLETLLVTHLESNVIDSLTTQDADSAVEQDEQLITDSEALVIGSPIRIEAESMNLNGYQTEHTSVASNDRLIRTSSSGTATTSFTGDTGYYNIVIAYYDENDGLARISASLAGVELDDWQLDQNLDSYIASANNLVTRTIATQIQVNNGDILELQGLREYNEFARVDYVEFIPVSPPSVESQTISGNQNILEGNAGNDILFGGEDNDLIYGESQTDGSSNLLKGAQTYNGHTYLLTEVSTWTEAQDKAQSLGGNLVTINNAGEESWLQQTFGTNERLWLGINDQNVEGQFEWVNGETVTYTNWAPGEPNNRNGSQDFGTLNFGNNKQWDDETATKQFRGIVEIYQSDSDILVGGEGDDTLYGNAGDDILYGDDLESESSSLINGLVGHWQFDETTGTQAIDATGAHTGTLTNMSSNQWTSGQVGGALNFDGGNDQVMIADSSALDLTNTLTLATWVKADSFQSFDGLISKGTSTVAYGLDLNKTGSLIFTANYGSLASASNGGDWYSDTRLTAGQWHHVAVTYDGDHIRFYVDGQLDTNVVQADIQFGTSNEALVLGAEIIGSHFDGALDDTRVYNRALSADEINVLANISDNNNIESDGGNDTLLGGVGSDTLVGGAGNDSLHGTDAIAVGYFEQDILTGGSGADRFILGDANQSYYQGRGDQDFAQITDFNAGEDLVILSDAASYTLEQQGYDTYLYADSDLVAIFENVTSLNLSTGFTVV